MQSLCHKDLSPYKKAHALLYSEKKETDSVVPSHICFSKQGQHACCPDNEMKAEYTASLSETKIAFQNSSH